MSNELDALQSALLGPTFNVDSDEQIAIKAEDIQQGGGVNWSEIFFEPQVNKNYLIKFLPNPGGEPFTFRSVYKSLPDPWRKGKSFHYVSSGNAKTCPVLELFFDLNNLKKNGDIVAEKKIKDYLGKTNQLCAKVQILQSPEQEEIGKIKLFCFSNFGPNATIATLVNQKLNPTKEQIEQGFEREDICNIFGSSVLSIVCKETTYDGNKGRDFSQSVWAPKKRGAIAIKEDGSQHEFKTTDLENGKLKPEVNEWFQVFFKNITRDEINVKKQFAYKTPNDPDLDEDTRKYVEDVFKKVEEIVPVIRDCSIAEIKNYGKREDAPSAKKEKNGTNVLAESVPDELAGSVMAAGGDNKNEKKDETKAAETDADVDAILNS